MIRVGIVGTGMMANQHAIMMGKIRGVALYCAFDLNLESLDLFCAKHSINKTFQTLDEMLADPSLDAICNVTPDRFHKEISIQALKAGKHVFCEKPLAENYQDALEMAEVAKESGLINMVNLSYRAAPVVQKAKKLIESGKIGEVRHVDASYLQSWCNNFSWGGWHDNPAWLWRMSTAHGSKGVLGDVGVHIIDFASYPVGKIETVQANLTHFPKGENGKWKEYTLDANDSALLTVEFENGAMGTIQSTRWASGHANTVKVSIYGTKGGIEIDLSKSMDELQLCSGDKALVNHTWRSIKAPKSLNNFKRFIKGIQTGVQDSSDFKRGAEIQKIIDASIESNEQGRKVALDLCD